MPLYCYIITYYEWECQEHGPVFHENKYTREEFQDICEKAFKQIKNESLKDKGYFYPHTDKLIDYLVEHYGFQKLDNKLLIHNMNDIKTGYRNDGDIDNYI